jgi:hypothetical protein
VSTLGLHDVTCVAHVHSTYSDGTGTVPQIARAAQKAGVEVVLLTDHDTLEAKRRGEEGWQGDALVLVGCEVSPVRRDHFLAFGIEREPSRRLSGPEIAADVAAQGGFGFAAHPFSRGSARFDRIEGMPFAQFADERVTGLEVWSFLSDTAERLGSLREVLRFVLQPGRVLEHPPEQNVAEWDALTRQRRVVGIAGIDAHQVGVRVLGRVPLRLMGYARSFRHLRTHALCREPLTRELEHDRDQVFGALRDGRCFMAREDLRDASGFEFFGEGAEGTLAMGAESPLGEGYELRVRSPRHAELRLLRNGRELMREHGRFLSWEAAEPGAYRIEARCRDRGRDVTWVLTNPIYLRAGS